MTSSSSFEPEPKVDFNRIWAECPHDTHLKLPWEKGFWKDFFEGAAPPRTVRDWKVMEPPLFIPCVSAAVEMPSKRPRMTEPVMWQHVVKSGAEQNGRTSVRLISRCH